MARLLVLRHGKTEIVSSSGQDIDRALVSRGFRNSRDMGALLHRHMPVPDLVLISPSMRTRQTAESVLGAMKYNQEPVVDDRIYNATVDDLQDVLADYAWDSKTVLIIGHNPGLILLTLTMLDSDDDQLAASVMDFPTCSLADIVFDAATLGDMRPGTGKLLSLLKPREIGFNS